MFKQLHSCIHDKGHPYKILHSWSKWKVVAFYLHLRETRCVGAIRILPFIGHNFTKNYPNGPINTSLTCVFSLYIYIPNFSSKCLCIIDIISGNCEWFQIFPSPHSSTSTRTKYERDLQVFGMHLYPTCMAEIISWNWYFVVKFSKSKGHNSAKKLSDSLT